MSEVLTDVKSARDGDRALLPRIGGACAVLGAIVSVAAGTGFGNLTNEYGAEAVLNALAARPPWFWPLVHLGFIAGALLWVGAFVALARSMSTGVSRSLGRLSVAAVLVGATVHVIDSAISGYALGGLAHAWATAGDAGQAQILDTTRVLLWVLGGTWSGVLSFFHGLPFILLGMAVALDRRTPAWLGLVGVLGGAGSLAAGLALFLDLNAFPGSLFIAFAVIISLWMVIMGVIMWRDGRTTPQTRLGHASV
ncbi:MAG: hypothetical protein ACRDN9_10720 [Streptosporangiaceae bacterium]